VSDFRGGHFLAIFLGFLVLAAGSCASFLQSDSEIAASLFFLASGAAIGAVVIRVTTWRSRARIGTGIGGSLVAGGLATFLGSALYTMFEPVRTAAFTIVGLVSVAIGIATIAGSRWFDRS
jgi:hypothetical protein